MRLERRAMLPDPDKRFLNDLVGRVCIPYAKKHLAVHKRLVFAEQFTKGVRIRVLHPGQQRNILAGVFHEVFQESIMRIGVKQPPLILLGMLLGMRQAGALCQ